MSSRRTGYVGWAVLLSVIVLDLCCTADRVYNPADDLSTLVPCVKRLIDQEESFHNANGRYGNSKDIHAPQVCRSFATAMELTSDGFAISVYPQEKGWHQTSAFVNQTGTIRIGILGLRATADSRLTLTKSDLQRYSGR